MYTRLATLILFGAATACSAQESAAPPDVPNGSALYARHCSACHGRYGEGDGPVAIAMSVDVPNLRTLARREGGTFPRDSVIAYIDGRDQPAAHGDRYMPVWGDVFRWGEPETDATEAEVRARIEALADYLERIQSR